MFHRVVYGAVDIEREPYLIPMARTSRGEKYFKYLGKFIMVIIMHQYASLELNKIFDLQNI